MSRKVIKRVKHLNISDMRLTSADELPPSDAVTLRSTGASPLPLDILCVATGKEGFGTGSRTMTMGKIGEN